MPSKGLTSIVICCAGILIIALFIVKLNAVEAESSIQTWPSRTPSPGPEQTQPPSESTPGGGGQATATGESSPSPPTPTAHLTVPAVSPLPPTVVQPSAVGTVDPETNEPEIDGSGNIGTELADTCTIPPIIQALGPASVRTGAGVGHQIVGFLRYSEMRTIIGRAENGPWWLIIFDSENDGWISDQAVSVHGYTGYVSVIETGKATTSTGTMWNPTPNPECTPPAPIAASNASSILDPVVDSDVSEEFDSTANGQQISSDQESESANTPADDQHISEFDDRQNEPQANNSTFTWLLITGIFLVVVGAISLFIRRRNF